jgi:aerobic-type carbon monoxide dehydrogenase small subunit (CoxS/CutS family)
MPNLNLNLKINDQDIAVVVPSGDMPLLWVLRDIIGLTGTKYGCGIKICGACSVLVNGHAEKSCEYKVSEAVGKRITTVEGLSADRSHPAQVAWIAHQVPQCGWCQSGMLVAVAGAMNAGHHGSDIAPELDNVCVCGTYQRIREALPGL